MNYQDVIKIGHYDMPEWAYKAERVLTNIYKRKGDLRGITIYVNDEWLGKQIEKSNYKATPVYETYFGYVPLHYTSAGEEGSFSVVREVSE